MIVFQKHNIEEKSFFKNRWNVLGLFEIIATILAECLSTTARNKFSDDESKPMSTEDIEFGFERDKISRLLFSFVSLSIWIHLLYFFRIFRTTGYYIRMIVQVIDDIKYFIFIFAVVVIAFGNAFHVFLYN